MGIKRDQKLSTKSASCQPCPARHAAHPARPPSHSNPLPHFQTARMCALPLTCMHVFCSGPAHRAVLRPQGLLDGAWRQRALRRSHFLQGVGGRACLHARVP
eukprot:365029-Chlamydomonas_euryale.AAC.10